MTGQDLPQYTESTTKLPELEQQIIPTFEAPEGIEALNKEVILPIEHTNFLDKNGIGEGRTIESAGTILKSRSINQQQYTQQSQKGSTTNIIIDKVEIADGVINDVESFIQQLKNKVIA